MSIHLLLFVVPVVAWVLIAKLFLVKSFTWLEAGIQGLVTSLVILLLFFAGSHTQTSDVKFVNGVVDKLELRKQSCPWGWQSTRDSHCTEYHTRSVKVGESCTTNSNGKRSCSPIYETEYKYIYDWERRFYVHADYMPPYSDSTYEVNRVDSQGVATPPKFAETSVGDPVTKQVSFKNYIKGASNSLFSEEPSGDNVVLAYPRVKDSWHANRVIVSGIKVDSDDWAQWNKDMMQVNSNLRATGANAIVVLTDGDREFSEMLARAWHAHNINDVVTVIGLDGDIIKWVEVDSWSNTSLVEIEIRDQIKNLGSIDMTKVHAIIEKEIQSNFELKSMTEFEYLADDIHPPTWVFILAFVVLLVLTPCVTFVLHKYDVV